MAAFSPILLTIVLVNVFTIKWTGVCTSLSDTYGAHRCTVEACFTAFASLAAYWFTSTRYDAMGLVQWGLSVKMMVSIPSSSCYPHSVRFKWATLPSHSWTVKWARYEWYFVAAEVGGRIWSWNVLDVLLCFLIYCNYINLSSAVTDCLALYNFSSNSSPTLTISSALALLCLNTSSMFQSHLPNTSIAFLLPVPYIADMVSHPVMACAFKICWHVCGAIFCWMLFIL